MAGCKSPLTPSPTPVPTPVVYSTDRSEAVILVLVLLIFALWFNSTRRFVLCLTLCYFALMFFSPFSIAITSLGEERANLSSFHTFVRFALVWFCLFSLPLWEGLRFVSIKIFGIFFAA